MTKPSINLRNNGCAPVLTVTISAALYTPGSAQPLANGQADPREVPQLAAVTIHQTPSLYNGLEEDDAVIATNVDDDDTAAPDDDSDLIRVQWVPGVGLVDVEDA